MEITIFFDTESGEDSVTIRTEMSRIDGDIERAMQKLGRTMDDYTGMEAGG